MRRAPTSSLALCVVLCVSLAAASARAQTPADYDRTVREAIEEFAARRFEEARVLFRRAHVQSPNARTLRGVGMAAFELSDYVDAYLSLTAALAETRRPLTREMRAQTEALRDRASTFVGRLALTLEPADATVRVSGATPTYADGVILINPGTHSLTVSSPDHVERIESIRIEAGRTTELLIRLARIPGSALAGAEVRPSRVARVVLGTPTITAFVDVAAEGDAQGGHRRRNIALVASSAVVVAAVVLTSVIVARNARDPYTGTLR